MIPDNTYLARITPIVGNALHHQTVAILGLEHAWPVIECLAASGIRHWGVPHTEILPLQQALMQRHPVLQAVVQACTSRVPNLVIAIGAATHHLAICLAEDSHSPAILINLPSTHSGCSIQFVFPGECGSAALADQSCPDPWAWACAAPLVAGFARALLLKGTAYARQDLAALWERGMRMVTLAGSHPCDIHWGQSLSLEQNTGYTSPVLRRGSLLIAGLGSLGSVAAAHLAPYCQKLLLADPDRVELVNPIRQHYRLPEVGSYKAIALATSLNTTCPHTIALPRALDQGAVTAILERETINAALVVTGTDADFGIARALRDHAIPHVVARCYPRARYWEAILVDGQSGPSFEQIRGYVRPEPAAPPTPEQRAAYSDAGALEAEPATLVESGWAAAWAARLTHQLSLPHGLRERWLLEFLQHQQTCLVGGVGVEHTPAGPAYAIAEPGQIHAWRRG